MIGIAKKGGPRPVIIFKLGVLKSQAGLPTSSAPTILFGKRNSDFGVGASISIGSKDDGVVLEVKNPQTHPGRNYFVPIGGSGGDELY